MTAFSLATRYLGIAERPGGKHHPIIQWGFELCGLGADTPDEVAWCSAWAQVPAWELRLPRSKSAAARSWLTVGTPILLDDASADYDVVILKRGPGKQPGPEVVEGAPGHVGYYAGREGAVVLVLGGNQRDPEGRSGGVVSVARFPVRDVLGVRRLAG